MSQKLFQAGRGSEILVAPMNDCQRILPEYVRFTVATTAGDAGDNTLSVTWNMLRNQAGVIQTAPATPTLDITGPFWLSFRETTGKEVLVKVTGNVDGGVSAGFVLDVDPLVDDIAVGAIAHFPSKLQGRQTINVNTNDSQNDIMVFENNGWGDSLTTMLNTSITANGFFSALDPGWITCDYVRRNFLDLYYEVRMPKPGCDTAANIYTTGYIFRGFGGVNSIPVEIPADNIISSNIEIQGRGEQLILAPTVTPTPAPAPAPTPTP